MDSDSNQEIFKCKSFKELKNSSTVSLKKHPPKFSIQKAKERGTFHNHILRNCVYVICGCIVTYFLFALMVFELSISVLVSTILCSILGLILVVAMICSENFRCLVCLILPQLFSKRGRQALVAYAFIITLTGPTKNTIQNIGRLSESLVCNREQLRQAGHDLKNALEQPFYAIRDSLNKTVTIIQENIDKLKNKIHSIEDVVKKIISIFDSAFSWLSSVVGICNEKLGTPYERCTKSLEIARKNCTAKVPKEYMWACEPSSTAETLCYIAKIADYMCQLVDIIDEKVVEIIQKKLDELTERTKEMLYFSVDFSHSFEFDTNSSKSSKQVASEVIKDLLELAKKIEKLFSLTGAIFSVFVLLLLLRVIWYRQRFLASDRFDNHYITSHFTEIDAERVCKSKISLLPLNKRENRHYIPATSVRLIRNEKISLLKTAIFLILTTIKMAVHMTADYCLFWLMDMVHNFGMLQSNIPVTTGGVKMVVKGDGFLADLHRSMADSLSLNVSSVNFDPKSCLPDPHQPNYDVYKRIGYILLLCWVSAIFEPYGLRVRHFVMSHYYPERAHQRTLWLYHDILKRRSSFFTIAKRQIKEKFSEQKNYQPTTFRDYFIARIPCLRSILKDTKQENCTVCGDRLKNLKRCLSPGCTGMFCKECFEDLNRICPVCKVTEDADSYSDFSIERDSSDEDIYKKPASSDKFYYGSTSYEDKISEQLLKSKFGSRTTQLDTSETESVESNFSRSGDFKYFKTKDRNEFELKQADSKLQLFDDDIQDNALTDDEDGTDCKLKTILSEKPTVAEDMSTGNVLVFTWGSMKKTTERGKKRRKKTSERVYEMGIEDSETFENRRKGIAKTALDKVKNFIKK